MSIMFLYLCTNSGRPGFYTEMGCRAEETYFSFTVLNYTEGCRSAALPSVYFEVYAVRYAQIWRFSKESKIFPSAT